MTRVLIIESEKLSSLKRDIISALYDSKSIVWDILLCLKYEAYFYLLSWLDKRESEFEHEEEYLKLLYNFACKFLIIEDKI